MEEGKRYRVFYNDGERVRDKHLIFKKNSDGFALFFNPFNKMEESINISYIIRVESGDDRNE